MSKLTVSVDDDVVRRANGDVIATRDPSGVHYRIHP
jgi:hypothetical protein